MNDIENLLIIIERIFNMPPEDAVDYLKSMGYEITDDWIEVWGAIKNHSFTVSHVASADALQIIHEGLVQAIEEGKTLEEFQNEVGSLLEIKGFKKRSDGSAWRFDVIFRTNIQSAYQAGRFFEMEAAGEAFPYRQYIAVRDIRTTEGCRELDGSVFLHTDPFYLQNQTPRHFNCRATWIALPKDEKVQLKTSYDFPNTKPAPGFGISPLEKAWQPDLSKYSPAIQSKLKEILNKKQ